MSIFNSLNLTSFEDTKLVLIGQDPYHKKFQAHGLSFSVPDGIAFDTQGNLYISCYRPDRIYRLSVDGELEILVEDYEGTLMAAPTNIAFCGPRRDDLLSANLGRWHISRYELDAIGIPLNYPTIK